MLVSPRRHAGQTLLIRWVSETGAEWEVEPVPNDFVISIYRSVCFMPAAQSSSGSKRTYFLFRSRTHEMSQPYSLSANSQIADNKFFSVVPLQSVLDIQLRFQLPFFDEFRNFVKNYEFVQLANRPHNRKKGEPKLSH